MSNSHLFIPSACFDVAGARHPEISNEIHEVSAIRLFRGLNHLNRSGLSDARAELRLQFKKTTTTSSPTTLFATDLFANEAFQILARIASMDLAVGGGRHAQLTSE
jgi:hypothetical protein